MMKYESMYIIKPDMEEEARAALIARFSDIITADGGEIESIEEWGNRKLAYPINYISEGYYVLMTFKANSALPAELERNFKISDYVMRFIVIKKDEE